MFTIFNHILLFSFTHSLFVLLFFLLSMSPLSNWLSSHRGQKNSWADSWELRESISENAPTHTHTDHKEGPLLKWSLGLKLRSNLVLTWTATSRELLSLMCTQTWASLQWSLGVSTDSPNWTSDWPLRMTSHHPRACAPLCWWWRHCGHYALVWPE